MKAQDALLRWLAFRLEPAAQTWLQEHCQKLAAESSDKQLHKTLYLSFSQAVRHTGKNLLEANAAEQAEAHAVHPGWNLSGWTLDQAARVALLLSLPPGPKTIEALLALQQSADLGEHLALVRALFLLPDAKGLLHIAREAIRSNMRDVFAAISQNNPYPEQYCDDIAWNQMVVKCLFVDLPLRSIYGLDRRANSELCRILVDLSRERLAAGRPLSPEAWRCVGPFADSDVAGGEQALLAMEMALNGTLPERRGAALGLWASPGKKGHERLRARAPELVSSLENGTLSWENYDA